jgi:hypothetical protein
MKGYIEEILWNHAIGFPSLMVELVALVWALVVWSRHRGPAACVVIATLILMGMRFVHPLVNIAMNDYLMNQNMDMESQMMYRRVVWGIINFPYAISILLFIVAAFGWRKTPVVAVGSQPGQGW